MASADSATSPASRHPWLTPTLRGFAAATVVVVCWSGFNIVSRLGGRSVLTPFDLAALRCGVAALLLLPVFLRMRCQATPLQMLTLALLGGTCYSLLVYSGFSRAPAAHAGVLVNGGIPAATAILAWLAFGYRMNLRAVAALLVAGIGILLIAYQSLAHAPPPMAGVSKGPQWLGDLFFLAAAVCYACFGLLVRRWHIRPVEAMVSVCLVAAVVYLPIYFLFLPKAWMLATPAALTLQAVYQGIVAAMVASVCYAYATLTIGPMKASLMLALVPGISAVAAVPFLGEELTVITVLGVVLVTGGAVLGTTNPNPPTAPAK